MNFPVSGIEVFPLWPFLVAFLVSFFCSMGGISGAFLLLPYQVSVLGFDRPAVSSTNLVFNIVAIPSGVVRFIREGRMVWPLTILMMVGLVPGVTLGVWMRLKYLPDPRSFQLFVGCVLLYIAGNLVVDLVKGKRRGSGPPPPPPGEEGARVRTTAIAWRRCSYEWMGETYSFDPRWVLLLMMAVGAIGTTYGIGGGALVAPFLVSIFRLPVHTIAGAALASTFTTSVIGVIAYTWIAPILTPGAESTSPDWWLGLLLGAGGLLGIYLGARLQRFVSERAIKVMLTGIMFFLAVKYIGPHIG